jgi:tetratricopeptide (TPR) repeat protein
MDYIEKKSVSFFYSGMDHGSNYNYVGLVYPTISIGSFGFGWMRLATDGIEETTPSAIRQSTFSHSRNVFLFSYSKQLMSAVSFGGSIKISNFDFTIPGNELSDTGVGGDVGLLFRPEFDSAFLRDVAFGVNIQNIISPSARLVNESQSTPINFKAGLAKIIYMGEGLNALTFSFDLDKSEKAPSVLHFGGEFSFQRQAFIRAGMNNGQIMFGAGASYRNYHLDYNYGKFFDTADFSGGHRLTFTVELGKGKQELIRLAQERRQRELEIRLAAERWFEQEQEFYDAMTNGRSKYYSGDYLGSLVQFTIAEDAAISLLETATSLQTTDLQDDDSILRVQTANTAREEVQTMLSLAAAKSDSVNQVERERIYQSAAKSTQERELKDFVDDHNKRGAEFFVVSQFDRAIAEWNLALDRLNRYTGDLPEWAPEFKLSLENKIATAEEQLKGNVQESIKRADRLARRGDYLAALEELNNIRSGLTSAERVTVDEKIRTYQNQLTFDQNFREGSRYYSAKDWQNAVNALDRALQFKPGHSEAKQLRDAAYARSIATVQDMPGEIRSRYVRARILYRESKYQEALDLLQQCLEQQPYNKTLLDMEDIIRERLKQQ